MNLTQIADAIVAGDISTGLLDVIRAMSVSDMKKLADSAKDSFETWSIRRVLAYCGYVGLDQKASIIDHVEFSYNIGSIYYGFILRDIEIFTNVNSKVYKHMFMSPFYEDAPSEFKPFYLALIYSKIYVDNMFYYVEKVEKLQIVKRRENPRGLKPEYFMETYNNTSEFQKSIFRETHPDLVARYHRIMKVITWDQYLANTWIGSITDEDLDKIMKNNLLPIMTLRDLDRMKLMIDHPNIEEHRGFLTTGFCSYDNSIKIRMFREVFDKAMNVRKICDAIGWDSYAKYHTIFDAIIEHTNKRELIGDILSAFQALTGNEIPKKLTSE